MEAVEDGYRVDWSVTDVQTHGSRSLVMYESKLVDAAGIVQSQGGGQLYIPKEHLTAISVRQWLAIQIKDLATRGPPRLC